MMKLFPWCLCLVFLFGTRMVGEGSDDPELTIRVSGAEPSEGRIHLAVFASRSDYLKVPLKDLNRSVDEKGEAVFVLTLPKGQYSACAFYDKNDNGKLDKGFLGIPKELVAFSNQAKGLFGPPSYKATLFELNKDTTHKLRLGKAKD